jgi:hypothetical protein
VATKPSEGHATWTDGAVSKITDPGASKKLLGWEANERPPFDFFNWILFVLNEWQLYFEEVTDAFPTNEFDAIVAASGGTHTTLAAATAAAVSGWKILVIDAEPTVVTTANITVDDVEVEFKPGAHFTDGGATTAISITGDRCRIRGGRFLSFTAQAIEIQAAASFTMTRDNRFNGNTIDINDSGTLTSSIGDISE